MLPEYLAEVHQFWQREGLDGVYPEVAKKIGPNAVELIGLGLVLSEQTLLALHVRLRTRERSDELEWMEVRLGEMTAEGLRSTPYDLDRLTKEMQLTARRIAKIDWAFAIEYGEGR